MDTLAIVPAAGSGSRMGGVLPKQYLALGGVPVLARTLLALQASALIDQIFLAVAPGDEEMAKGEIVDRYGLSKVSRIVSGGRQRQDSVRNALASLPPGEGIVLIHDGVRPFVSKALIERVVLGAQRWGAVTAGLEVTDTVKEVTHDGWVQKTISRTGLWLTQTPQAFKREVILAAHDRARRDGYYGTDDASLVERLGINVRMIPGEADNIKLTTPEDLLKGEFIAGRYPIGS